MAPTSGSLGLEPRLPPAKDHTAKYRLHRWTAISRGGLAPTSLSSLTVPKVPLPDFDTLSDLANAAAYNARRLLADAEILLTRGRWPTAYSLAVLALEEAGKGWLCVVAIFLPDEARPEFPFGDLDWDHKWKLGSARGVADMLAFIKGGEGAPANVVRAAEELEELARADNEAKKRGFYADYRDGVIWRPSQMTERQARRMVADVRDVLYNSGPLLDPDFISWIANLPDDVGLIRDEFWDHMTEAFRQGGYRAISQTLQAEFSKLEGLAQMLEEDAHRIALNNATPAPESMAARTGRRVPSRKKRQGRRR